VGRIRSIKPEFPHSETIGNLSRDARLLFIQLWTLVDDAGRARASSRLLASLLYPFDDDAAGLMLGWLAELEAQGCLYLYQADGGQYLEICKWLKHQKIDHPSASRLPAYSASLENPREDSRSLAPDLGPRTKDLGPILVGDSTPDVDPGASKSKVDLITPLVKDGWDYWLERTERDESQNKLTQDRLAMGRKGFESLIAFAKERKAPEPVDAAVQLFRAAIDRMASSPFHSGQNEQGTSYNNWQHLFSGRGYPSPRKLLEFWLDDTRWDKCS
jgi:hypothetical protein